MAESTTGLTYALDPMQVEEGPSNEVSDEATDQAEVPQRGRKQVRNPDSWKSKHVKKKGLRQNASQVSIDDLVGTQCRKKTYLQCFPMEHLVTLQQQFANLTYDEQNLYLTGLMIIKETKKSVGRKRKSNPTLGKFGKKIGRPLAEESSFSVEYIPD